MTRTLSIAIKDNTYQQLKQKIGVGKISSFVNQAVEKELKELTQAANKEIEELNNRLIAAYKRESENQTLQEELSSWDEISGDGLDNE